MVLIGKAQRDRCRWCKIGPETGDQLVFEYIHWDFWRPLREVEGEWRKWKTGEDLDLRV